MEAVGRLSAGVAHDFNNILTVIRSSADTVSDTGIGMTEETRARIFEPFYTTRGQRGGTGLGLAMVHGITHQSGGAIHVESRPGQGSTFVLRFPALDVAPEVTAPSDARPNGNGALTGRILIVEDDDAVRRVTAFLLERAGWTVHAVGDVRSGLEALDRGDPPFDVVLTDLLLPGTSGHDLLQRVGAAPGRPAMVAMSGYSASEEGGGRDIPAEVRFLAKPFTRDELVHTLGQALSDGRAVAGAATPGSPSLRP